MDTVGTGVVAGGPHGFLLVGRVQLYDRCESDRWANAPGGNAFQGWDSGGARAERIDVLDAATGAVLDTRTISNFSKGQYLF